MENKSKLTFNHKREWVPQVSDSDVYRFLTTYYLYQDQLSWSRVIGLITVEAALLAASFAKKGIIGIFALVLACTFCWLIKNLLERDWQIRDQDLKFLDHVHIPRGIVIEVLAKNKLREGGFILNVLFRIVMTVNIIVIVLLIAELKTGASYL